MIIHDFRPSTSPPPRRFTLSPEQKMLLMPIGDIHYGAPGFPADRLRAHIEWGVEQGAYFLGMGDFVDFTSRSQRGVLRGLRDSQRELLDNMNMAEVEKLAAILAPSKGRWLGMLEGDHYHEFEHGITSDQQLCRLLEAPFLGTSTLLRLQLQDPKRPNGRRSPAAGHGCDVYVFAAHGFGGGRLEGSGLNALGPLLKYLPQPSIYLMAHNHSKVNAVVDALVRTPGGFLYHTPKILARTGGWLRGYMGQRPQEPSRPAARSRGSYIERAAYAPAALGGLVFSIGYKRVTEHEGGRVVADFYRPDIHYSV